jgi:hypothetical protein
LEYEVSRKINLQAAIDSLYQVFRPYSSTSQIDYCGHCVTESDVLRLHTKPLRELNAAELDKFAFKAITTWGELTDFKHFLPRIFELLASQAKLTFQTDIETIITKAKYANWRSWPELEQAAIIHFLKAWWNWWLVSDFSYSSGSLMASCLESILLVTPDLKPYLDDWRESYHISANALQNTAAFLDYYYSSNTLPAPVILNQFNFANTTPTT